MADDSAQTVVPPVAASGTDVETIRGLIQSSTVLRDDEREYWLGLLPQMNETQLVQLKGILVGQQSQIQQIDQKYDQKLQAVGEKTLQRWDGEKVRAKRLKRESEEQGHQEESHEEAEALLGSWE
jgi:hypothetical protein